MWQRRHWPRSRTNSDDNPHSTFDLYGLDMSLFTMSTYTYYYWNSAYYYIGLHIAMGLFNQYLTVSHHEQTWIFWWNWMNFKRIQYEAPKAPFFFNCNHVWSFKLKGLLKTISHTINTLWFNVCFLSYSEFNSDLYKTDVTIDLEVQPFWSP